MDAENAKKVLDYVDPDRVVRLLQEMVRIPSPTYEEAALADFIAGYMEDLGIETEMVVVEDPYGSDRVSRQPVGILRGDGSGPSLMFNGHMDHNMLAGRREDWDRDPFSGDVDDKYLYGRGSIDEKGGIAGLLTAGEAIKKWGIPLKGDLILCPVMGHKSGAIGTRHHIKRGLTADLCINTETTDLGIITAGVGVTRIHVTFKGRPVHFSSPQQHKAQAAFPVQQMAQFITRLGPDVMPLPDDGWMTFSRESQLPGYPMLSVDSIESQYMPVNYCKLNMQVRTVPGQTAETLQEDLEALLESIRNEVPNIEAELEAPPHGGWNFPPYKGPRDHILPQTLARWHEQMSGRPADVGCGPRLGAVGDANYIANTGVATVQYGPGGIAEYEQWPAINERIKIEDLLVGARTMSLTAAEICGA